jgi:hypothetical protein
VTWFRKPGFKLAGGRVVVTAVEVGLGRVSMSNQYEGEGAEAWRRSACGPHAAKELRRRAQDDPLLLRDHLLDLAHGHEQEPAAEQPRSHFQDFGLGRGTKQHASDGADPSSGRLDTEALATAKPVVASKARAAWTASVCTRHVLVHFLFCVAAGRFGYAFPSLSTP